MEIYYHKNAPNVNNGKNIPPGTPEPKHTNVNKNLIAINNNVIFLPIIDFSTGNVSFIRLAGKRTFNVIKELYLQSVVDEKDFLLPIKPYISTSEDLSENLDIIEQTGCLEHLNKTSKIEDKNKVEVNEIVSLYGELFGKNKPDYASSKEGIALLEFFKNNKIYKKEFVDTKCYFDKQEVYEKFFKLKVKKAITEFLIFDFDDLIKNKIKVKKYLQNNP